MKTTIYLDDSDIEVIKLFVEHGARDRGSVTKILFKIAQDISMVDEHGELDEYWR
jgi:hypothetical protein